MHAPQCCLICAATFQDIYLKLKITFQDLIELVNITVHVLKVIFGEVFRLKIDNCVNCFFFVQEFLPDFFKGFFRSAKATIYALPWVASPQVCSAPRSATQPWAASSFSDRTVASTVKEWPCTRR